MSGSTSFRIEVSVTDNTSDAEGATAYVTRRGEDLTLPDFEEAFTAALKSVGFEAAVSID